MRAQIELYQKRAGVRTPLTPSRCAPGYLTRFDINKLLKMVLHTLTISGAKSVLAIKLKSINALPKICSFDYFHPFTSLKS